MLHLHGARYHTPLGTVSLQRRNIMISRSLALVLVLVLGACGSPAMMNRMASDEGYKRVENVPYERSRGLDADVYYPPQAADAPVVVFFYGGRWQQGDKAEYRFVGQALASRGYVAVLPNVRKYPDVRFPAFMEDAAQGLQSTLDGRALGTFGELGALSFHETKNVISGEGGALIVTDPALVERAEIIHEKGTNRRAFFRGQVDKYSWVDIGSSFVLSELGAAFLWAQIEEAQDITARRLAIWDRYHAGFADLEAEGRLRRPIVPAGATHNAHLYYLLMPTAEIRDAMLDSLRSEDVAAVFHYVPLHSAPAGLRFGRPAQDELPVTDDVSARLLRLPLWVEMTEAHTDRVIDVVRRSLERHG